jgi:hypothetical protein
MTIRAFRPVQLVGVPDKVRVNVSQFTPSIQVLSSSDPPPAAVPAQFTAGFRDGLWRLALLTPRTDCHQGAKQQDQDVPTHQISLGLITSVTGSAKRFGLHESRLLHSSGESLGLCYGGGVGVGVARPTWITTCAVFVLCRPRESVTLSRAG